MFAIRHTLLFALRPPSDAIPYLTDCRDLLGPAGTPVSEDRLHVTMLCIAHQEESFPTAQARRACAVGPLLATAPCRLGFDKLVGDGKALRLVASEQVRGLVRVRRVLGQLAHTHLGIRCRQSFSPHVTLRYLDRRGIDVPIDMISWIAGELVLIHSEVGRTRHHCLGRWPLRG